MNLSAIYKISFLSTLLLLASCEKVIELELNEAPPRIVVEAVMKDGVGNNSVLLSYTSAVYTDQTFDKISGAIVSVKDKDNNEFILTEDPYIQGYYTNSFFEVLPENEYTLTVDINGEIITSHCHSFAKPGIDSILYYQSPFAPTGIDTAYMIEYYSIDNGNEVNHYRLRIWINGVEQTEYYYIGNDDFINGQSYNAPFFGADAHKGDTVFIELMAIDKPYYTYLYTLSSNESNSTAPANPTSNLEGNAIGYFGAFSTDTMSIIIQ